MILECCVAFVDAAEVVVTVVVVVSANARC